jgi:hypothetical protein
MLAGRRGDHRAVELVRVRHRPRRLVAADRELALAGGGVLTSVGARRPDRAGVTWIGYGLVGLIGFDLIGRGSDPASPEP